MGGVYSGSLVGSHFFLEGVFMLELLIALFAGLYVFFEQLLGPVVPQELARLVLS